MTPIVVDPEALAGAGRDVTAVGDEFAAAVEALSSSLGGGALTGLDAAGLSFGLAYQRSAQALLDAGAAFVNASRNTGFGIGMSAANYSQADAASTIGGGAAPLTAPEKPQNIDTPSCPSSLGGGVMPPVLWSMLEHFIPDSWPDGDPGRLRASAAAWQGFASTIGGIVGELSAPLGVVGAEQIPEHPAMTSAIRKLSTSLPEMATEATKLATQTSEFAADVQTTHDAIRDLCDRISPSGFVDGIKAVFSGEALDELKKIADDVQQVLEGFGRQVSGRISLMESLITGLDESVVSLQEAARREFTHYLGDAVGGTLASAVEFESNVGEGVIKAGLQSVVGIQQLDPLRFAADPAGASAAWGGVLDTLKYASLTGIAKDPVGAFNHSKDMLGGIVHADDWRADRPGLGLGGVLFEAGSAATGVGAAKTALRGASAAADLGDAGQGARVVADAADGAAPIAGRASDIAGQLDDLTTLTDDMPAGATPGARGPAVPSSLAEPSVPHVPETPTPHIIPESASPGSVLDGPAPRSAEVPAHVPEVGESRPPEPGVNDSGTTAPEGSRAPIIESKAAAQSPSGPQPAIAESGPGPLHAAEMSPTTPSAASQLTAEAHSVEPPPLNSHVKPEDSPVMHGDSQAVKRDDLTSDTESGGDHHGADGSDAVDESRSHSAEVADRDVDRRADHEVGEEDSHQQPDHPSGLTPDMRDHILAMEKGLRPDPSEYLSTEFIREHLDKFSDGASRFMPETNVNRFGIAQVDGTSFMMTTHDADALLKAADGDPRVMERSLGLPQGFLDDNRIVRIDVPDPQEYDLRVPSGNEAGANSDWIPGGYLPDGFPEAVIDGRDIAPGEFSVTDIDDLDGQP